MEPNVNATIYTSNGISIDTYFLLAHDENTELLRTTEPIKGH